MPQSTSSSNWEYRIIVMLVTVVLAMGTALMTVGFWAGSLKNELSNTKETLAKKVDTNVYEANNGRIDQIILTLNKTDMSLSGDIKHMSDKIDKIYDILRTGD